MYKLLVFFALLAAAFAAPAPAPPLVYTSPFGYQAPYIPAAPVVYNYNPAGYAPALYPAQSPYAYTKFF